MIKDIFTSGWVFDESQHDIKNRYQMINIAILLSSGGLIYGIIGNFLRNIEGFIPIEAALLVMNLLMFFALRVNRRFFEFFAMVMTLQYTFLFLYLIYKGEPQDFKHLWVFTYPIILMYLEKTKYAVYWLLFMLFILIIAPLQNIVDVKYSIYQVTYISFVLIIVSVIIYFYQRRINEAKNTILDQQQLLLSFNLELEKKVYDKTQELMRLNESLELKVEQKLEELRKKDRILEIQSKQAVMGEMISMIAHQWRQPLSTITVQIANLQIRHMLGNRISVQEVEKALGDISDTIVYLSDTIDDFQTYFRPDKELSEIEIHELLQRAVNFVASRVNNKKMKISINKHTSIRVRTYINELVQVVLNILNNAIDAHGEGKNPEPYIDLYTESAEDTITIYVQDNAGGIDEQNLPRLFEPYFSTKGKNGTGLGLYMSQMIIQKQFGGEITVQNTPQGALCAVKIPKNMP